MKAKVIQLITFKTADILRPSWMKYGFGIMLAVALGFQLSHQVGDIAWVDLRISELGWRLVGLVIALSLANWSIEAVKWQHALRAKISFKQAIETVLVGLSFAVFTPGRIGDYAGRALHSGNDKHQEALVGTFICSSAQLAITLGTGMLASFLLMQAHGIAFMNWSPAWILIPLTIGLIGYFRVEKIVGVLKNLPLLNKLSRKEITITPSSQKLRILGLSMLRYSVYVIQMVVLMTAFDLKIPLTDAILGVSILFLVQTMIPMPMLFQVATKIELAMLLWAPFNPSPISLSLIMVLLWIVNVVVPALVGYRILNFNRIVKTQKSSS